VAYLRFSEQEPVWANWPLFRLKEEVVRGQNPNAPQQPLSRSVEVGVPSGGNSNIPASTAPPLWSKSPASAPARNVATAPRTEARSFELTDPFTGQVVIEQSVEQVSPAPPAQRRMVQRVVPANAEFTTDGNPFPGEPESAQPLLTHPDELQATPSRHVRPMSPVPREPLTTEFPEGSSDPFAEPTSRPRQHIQRMAGDSGLPPVNDLPRVDALPSVNELPAMEPVGLPETVIPPAGLSPVKVAPMQHPHAPPVQTPVMSLPNPQPIPSALPMQTRELPPGQPAMEMGLPGVSSPVTPARSVTTSPETAAKDDVYQVQDGDNYWTISRRFYGSARFFSALAEYNKHRISDPAKMRPGMYVLVPEMEVLHRTYPQLTGGGPRDPAEDLPFGFFIDPQGQPCFRVGKGDTLGHIAQKHLGRSSRWVQIYGLNREQIPDGKTLKIGSILRLPADASQVTLAPEETLIR